MSDDLKTYSFKAEITGSCTVYIDAKNEEEAKEKAEVMDFVDDEINEWSVDEIDVNSCEAVE